MSWLSESLELYVCMDFFLAELVTELKNDSMYVCTYIHVHNYFDEYV